MKNILMIFAIATTAALLVSCSDQLETGTFQTSVRDFKSVRVLSGTMVADSLPGIGIAHKVWVGDGILAVADLKTENLNIFSFPEVRPLKVIDMPYDISKEGIDFFETRIKGTLCGMRSRLGGRIDVLTEDLALEQVDTGTVYASPYNDAVYNDVLPVFLDNKYFWFSSVDKRDSVDTRSAYRIRRGSGEAEMICDLELQAFRGYDMNFFPWGVGTAYKRGKMMVYAYEQFKVVKFVQTRTGKERTLDFFKYFSNSSDARWKFIWGYYRGQIHVGRNRIYLSNYEYGLGNLARIYSTKEFPFPPFTTVETYSFNGKQLAVYQLDKEGFVSVDEKNRKIYLIDFDDTSVRSYDIPRKSGR